jgi:hypothetical protein
MKKTMQELIDAAIVDKANDIVWRVGNGETRDEVSRDVLSRSCFGPASIVRVNSLVDRLLADQAPVSAL